MSTETQTADDRTATDTTPQEHTGAADERPADPPSEAPASSPDDDRTEDDPAGFDSGARSIGVAMVSTPGDGSCGIGTYARDLLEAFDGGPTRTVTIDQQAQTVRHFVSLAVRAIVAPGDVIHVQHEYGLFRRDGSRYPGVLAVVFFPLLFALNAIRRKKVVVTFHSYLRPAPDDAPLRVRLFLRLTHGLITRFADHVIFLADEVATGFVEETGIAPERYTLLPHGVNVRRSSDVSREEAKRRFGLDPQDVVVGIPGFIRRPKGHDVFLEVARRLPEYEFLVAGGARPAGADFSYADSITRDPPENVTITGVLDDEEFPVALAAIDLALLPYRVVTQSGTFNWSAAQELPVLASDQPYFERLRRDWDVLETTPIDDPDVVAAHVRELVEDDERRATLRQNIRQYKEANSFARVADDHHRIYRTLLDGRTHHPTHVAETARDRGRAKDEPTKDRSSPASGGSGRESTPAAD